MKTFLKSLRVALSHHVSNLEPLKLAAQYFLGVPYREVLRITALIMLCNCVYLISFLNDYAGYNIGFTSIRTITDWWTVGRILVDSMGWSFMISLILMIFGGQITLEEWIEYQYVFGE